MSSTRAIILLLQATFARAQHGYCPLASGTAYVLNVVDETLCMDDNPQVNLGAPNAGIMGRLIPDWKVGGVSYGPGNCALFNCDGTLALMPPSSPPNPNAPPLYPPYTGANPSPPALPPITGGGDTSISQTGVSFLMHAICQRKCGTCASRCADKSDALAAIGQRRCDDTGWATAPGGGYCGVEFRAFCPTTSGSCVRPPMFKRTAAAAGLPGSAGCATIPPSVPSSGQPGSLPVVPYAIFGFNCAVWAGIIGGHSARFAASGKDGTCIPGNEITDCSLYTSPGAAGASCQVGGVYDSVGQYFYSAAEVAQARAACPAWCGLCTAGTCASWCTAYTCGGSACTDCDVCNTENHCESWCNDYTISNAYTMCKGCAVNLRISIGTHCASWCNAYTCGLSSYCSGCSACRLVASNAYCASWCNAYTTGPLFAGLCGGCVTG